MPFIPDASYSSDLQRLALTRSYSSLLPEKTTTGSMSLILMASRRFAIPPQFPLMVSRGSMKDRGTKDCAPR